MKVLEEALDAEPIAGHVGIAHTRWATHGVPTTQNAHPHISRDGIAIVHNGIIENHEALRAGLKRPGLQLHFGNRYRGHRPPHPSSSGLVRGSFAAVRKTVAELQGAYALAVVAEQDPECIVMARQGCPVVIGLGIDENFVASDVAALLPVTRRFMFLEEGDVAEVAASRSRVLDRGGPAAARARSRKRSAGGRSGARPISALHAQGDSRAAACDRADAGGANRRRQIIGRSLRP